MTSAAPSPSSGRHDVLVIGGRMDADRALLTPRGELVRGCADTLAEKLAQLPARTARVDLDMSGVRFMDTAGLRFLDVLRDHGRRRSVPVTATRWSGQPRRLLELVGLDTTDPLRPPRRGGAPTPSPPAPHGTDRAHMAEEEIEQLRQAIAARPVIDRARGILMASHGCSSDTAWRVLREASQLSGTGLRTVAAAVTAGAGRAGPRPPEEVREALATALARHLP
ncbi:ANTAR domain-containing protein [Streptomyces sp. NWU339]|uniref:ANTAR domain-containing protein n=1 Tax=Streptomyces sp. NWU339 TaxID=2185284 RepID=UPI0015E7EB8D|nr:ANTAR domain-containing protein [Streptomyces sp. NWU339]